MNKPNHTARRAATALLLTVLPAAAFAQNRLQDSLLRSGDLIGGRPHASNPRMARPAATTRATVAARPAARAAAGSADPTLARLLHQSIDINRLPPLEIATVYDQLLDVASEDGPTWSDREWADATGAVERLNARYQAVRQEVPLTERLKIRNLQGDFYSRQAAHTAKKRVNG